MSSNEPREVLTNLILDCREGGMSATESADHLLAAGVRPPARIITDAAELDTLPLMSVVLAYGVAHQAVPAEHVNSPVWFKPTGLAARTSVELLADTRGAGVTVLHEPEEV